MRISNNLPNDILQKPYFWVLIVAAALFTIYFGLLWKADDVPHLGMSGLFLAAVGSLIWDRKNELTFKTNLPAIIVASILIGLSLYSLTLDIDWAKLYGNVDFDAFLRISPLIFAIGLALIAKGFPGLKEYWREITIMFGLGVPSVVLMSINPALITAKLASFLLWVMGYTIGLEGIHIYFPHATIIVARGCSGMESMTYVLGIAILYLVMFPLKKIYNITVPIVAIAIGFFVNLIRVVTMSLLINYGKMEAFKYWHEGDGSLIVGIVAVLLFSAFYFTLVNYTTEEEEEDNNPELIKE